MKKEIVKREVKHVAFAAMRMQSSVHNGHHRLISQMLSDNDVVIIGLGSTQVSRTSKNPLTPEERTEMINILYGYKNPKIKIVKLIDKGAVDPKEWVDYCMQTIEDLKLPTPTDYYAGSVTDGMWFEDAVNSKGEKINLHILERHTSGIMSGTEIRASLANGTTEWKNHVPRCLHDYVEKTFPKEQTLKYQIENKKKIQNP